MHACRHQYPGRSDGSCSLILFHQRRPSPSARRVGSCVRCFEAYSVFTHVTTYMLTEPLERLFTSKAPTTSLPRPPLRLLPGGTNQFPGGTNPAEKHRLSRRTRRGFLAMLTFFHSGGDTARGVQVSSQKVKFSSRSD